MTSSKVINRFRGKYNFLSNFYFSYIAYDFDSLPFYRHDKIERNIITITNEHFFQACKAYSFSDHFKIVTSPNPRTAKKRGRKVNLRSDWDVIKIDVMRYGLKMKFDQNPGLKKKLIDTYPMRLEEGNTWNDTIWGVDFYTGYGMNLLGKLLMELRDDYMGFHIEGFVNDIIDNL